MHYKLKYWLWWHFKATDEHKVKAETIMYGAGISKGGKYIPYKKFIKKIN